MISASLCAEPQISVWVRAESKCKFLRGREVAVTVLPTASRPFSGLLRVTWAENLPTSGLKSSNVSEGEVSNHFQRVQFACLLCARGLGRSFHVLQCHQIQIQTQVRERT